MLHRFFYSRFADLLRRRHDPNMDVATAQAVLDVLPAKCQLIAEFHEDQIRFQATDENGFKSEWSGWFTWEGEPIKLNWNTFWIES